MKDHLTFEVGDKGHGQALPGGLLLEAGGKGTEGHRDVLLHLNLLDGASRAERAEVKVLAGNGTGHEIAEAGVANPLVSVLLQLLGRHQCQADAVFGHQQLPGEVVQLHRQLQDVPRHLERVGLPVAVPVVQAAYERGVRGTQAGRKPEVHPLQLSSQPEAFSLFPLVSPLLLCPALLPP